MIPLAECLARGIYALRSRNLETGVFNGDTGFVGIREKFGYHHLFTEYHYDCGPPHGTARPEQIIAMLPPEIIDLREYLGTVDKTTRRPVDFDDARKTDNDGWGWYWVDTGKSDPKREIHGVLVHNDILFDYLEGISL